MSSPSTPIVALAATATSDSIAVIGARRRRLVDPARRRRRDRRPPPRHWRPPAGTDVLVVVTADGDVARSGDLGGGVTVVGAGPTDETAAVTASVEGDHQVDGSGGAARRRLPRSPCPTRSASPSG